MRSKVEITSDMTKMTMKKNSEKSLIWWSHLTEVERSERLAKAKSQSKWWREYDESSAEEKEEKE